MSDCCQGCSRAILDIKVWTLDYDKSVAIQFLILSRLANVDVHLLNGMTSCQTLHEQYFLLLQVAYRADEMPSWQDAGQYFVSHFVIFCGPFIFRPVFPPCSDGIAIVVFHFVPGGRKAKKELEVEDLLPVGFAYLMSLRKMRCSDANPKKKSYTCGTKLRQRSRPSMRQFFRQGLPSWPQKKFSICDYNRFVCVKCFQHVLQSEVSFVLSVVSV